MLGCINLQLPISVRMYEREREVQEFFYANMFCTDLLMSTCHGDRSLYYYELCKSKVIPLQARCGPEGG